MLYIYAVDTWPAPVVLRCAWLAALGVVAGLLARWILGRHTGMLRFLAAWFGVVAGLWAADWVTQGYVGFGVLNFDHPYPDIIGLGELALPWLMVILGLRAWKRLPQKQDAPQPAPPVPPVPVPAPLPASVDVRPIPVREYLGEEQAFWFTASFRKIERWLAQLENWMQSWSNREVTVPLNQRMASEPMVSAPKVYRPVVVRHTAHTTPTGPQKQETEAEAEKEHRCPYCLEIVDLEDYRGIKVCHICGAYHHADCWDVKGSCWASHANLKP